MENLINQQVGERVAQVRTQMKMTQADLARDMSARLGRDIRPLTVTRLEGGKRPIGVDELVAAAAALGVEPSIFLNYDDETPLKSVEIISAYHSVVSGAKNLRNAVRQWDSAKKHLDAALSEAGQEDIDPLPTWTKLGMEAATGWTVEWICAEARKEGAGDDDESDA